MAVKSRGVLIAALGGGVVWSIWTLLNEMVAERYYVVEQAAGHLLQGPRYFFFRRYWLITVLLLACIASWFYASARATRGPGPGTALRVGVLFGFAISVPLNLMLATWSPMSRVVPLLWVVDLWGGAILGTLVASWIYRE